MKNPIPPHVGWPLLIVGLLCISIGASLFTVFAARSDGGAQIVDDYYQKAVHWDATAAARAASEALGWTTTMEVHPLSQSGLRVLDVTITDSTGAPVSDLRGTVTLYRPHRTGAVATIPLTAAPDAPGRYRQQVPLVDPGLWDIQVTAVGEGTPPYRTRLRHEVPR